MARASGRGGGLGGFVQGGVDDVRTVARGWRWGRRSLVPRSAEAYVEDRESSVFSTSWSRTGAATAVREVAQKGALEPLFRSQVRPHVEGLDVLGRVQGPVIFVANHASHLDTPLLLLSLPDEWRRRTAVAAAADYFFDTWWRAVGSALVFNTFPIERRGGSLAATPAEVLAEGWSLIVFPEGTRSPDGWLGKFRTGAAWLAVESQVPVIPVAHRGTFAAMPRGQGWPSSGRRPVTVRFGEPLLPAAGESARDFAPRVRAAVAALLDEDATTWWDARRRVAAGTTPDPSGPEIAQWRRVWTTSASPVIGGSGAGEAPARVAPFEPLLRLTPSPARPALRRSLSRRIAGKWLGWRAASQPPSRNSREGRLRRVALRRRSGGRSRRATLPGWSAA